MKSKEKSQNFKEYRPLAFAAGLGSLLGSGIIVGLSATITVWQRGLSLTNGQVGLISGALTFAIAFGSLLGGTFSKKIGLIKTFNWLNLFYGIGALICALSNGFSMMIVGVVLTGFVSGMDLPISLTVVSKDAPDNKISSELVSFTQLFWQIGIFISYLCAFLLSAIKGVVGARIVFLILTIIAIVTFAWRLVSPKLKKFHLDGEKRFEQIIRKNGEQKQSIIKVLFNSKNSSELLKYFFAILIFYVGWNLLANTWGQFQTFMFVKANATQGLATGYGIVTQLLGLPLVAIYAWVAGSKYRDRFFSFGSLVMLIAMVAMALNGTTLWVLMISIFLYGLGSNFSGEALYKVWTQESFPVEMRSSIQGLINGISRICCALFALVTPALVVPAIIKTTMWGFAGVVLIGWIAGLLMIKWQKQYHLKKD